jgi:hypothetical protein
MSSRKRGQFIAADQGEFDPHQARSDPASLLWLPQVTVQKPAPKQTRQIEIKTAAA